MVIDLPLKLNPSLKYKSWNLLCKPAKEKLSDICLPTVGWIFHNVPSMYHVFVLFFAGNYWPNFANEVQKLRSKYLSNVTLYICIGFRTAFLPWDNHLFIKTRKQNRLKKNTVCVYKQYRYMIILQYGVCLLTHVFTIFIV